MRYLTETFRVAAALGFYALLLVPAYEALAAEPDTVGEAVEAVAEPMTAVEEEAFSAQQRWRDCVLYRTKALSELEVLTAQDAVMRGFNACQLEAERFREGASAAATEDGGLHRVQMQTALVLIEAFAAADRTSRD